MRFSPTSLVVLAVAVVAGGGARAKAIDYETQVKPILAAKCIACHGSLRQRAGLRLDAAALILAGGSSGPVVEPGKSGASLLVDRVSSADVEYRMPPEGEGEPLTGQQISVLRGWIDAGADAPDDEPIPADPTRHWAYQPLERVAVRGQPLPGWGRNPIDRVLAAAQREAGIKPLSEADPATLLRRVYFNLVGLPPSRDQLRAFVRDPSPDAYHRVVDHLLGSPQYGQHWGRRWMDVWRYSDWTGYGEEIRYSQRHVWRWRDWIVESLNRDKGYDRMILEMIAGDELAPADPDVVRATGYLARNWYKFDRNSWLDDTVDHTARAFLGMTLKCARCHDHKYDPITHREYYRMRAVFEPYDVRVDRVSGELDVAVDGIARVYDARPDDPTYLFERGNPKRPDRDVAIAPGVPAVVGGEFRVAAMGVPLEAYYPALRPFVARHLLAAADEQVAGAQRAMDAEGTAGLPDESATRELESDILRWRLEIAVAERDAVAARIAAERARYGVADKVTEGEQERLAASAASAVRRVAVAEAERDRSLALLALDKARGESQADAASKETVAKAEQMLVEAEQKLEAAVRESTAATPDAAYEPLGPVHPDSSTGRRLALARWIADSANPLTPRVAVNHIWLRHFGQPLVERVDDFGLRSPRPPLARLLDHLAREFVDSGWSMKHIHRLIVTSAAFRQASAPVRGDTTQWKRFADNHAADPDNQFAWRMNVRRQDAESVRDAILLLAGTLNLQHGGPDIDPAQGFAILRRSLYFRHARERQMKFLTLFDAANPVECYRRQESVRPQQAFALLNTSLVLTASRQLAAELNGSRGSRAGKAVAVDDAAFVNTLFQAVLARLPSSDERKECLAFLNRQAARLSASENLQPLGDESLAVQASSNPKKRARENLALVLLNHNGFVTLR